jgi:hypothetical protein
VFDGFDAFVDVLGFGVYFGFDGVGKGVLLALVAPWVFEFDNEIQLAVNKLKCVDVVLEFEVAVCHQFQSLKVVDFFGVGILTVKPLLNVVGPRQHF